MYLAYKRNNRLQYLAIQLLDQCHSDDSKILKSCKNEQLNKSLRNLTHPTNRDQIFWIGPLSFFAEIDGGDALLYVKPIIFAVFQLIESLCGGLLRTVTQYCGKTAQIIAGPTQA